MEKPEEIDLVKEIRNKSWILHGELATVLLATVSCFVFVHHENVHVTKRLDNHIQQINQRTDDLHKEFYSLLKEMNKDK